VKSLAIFGLLSSFQPFAQLQSDRSLVSLADVIAFDITTTSLPSNQVIVRTQEPWPLLPRKLLQ